MKAVRLDGYGLVDIYVTVRFDGQCGNGHNTMSVTGNIYEKGERSDRGVIAAGCIHEEVLTLFPELKEAVDFHLCSTDGPMHYIVNTLYHARNREDMSKEVDASNLKAARSCAIWPTAELEDFTEEKLLERLPGLLERLKSVVESLGMVY